MLIRIPGFTNKRKIEICRSKRIAGIRTGAVVLAGMYVVFVTGSYVASPVISSNRSQGTLLEQKVENKEISFDLCEKLVKAANQMICTVNEEGKEYQASLKAADENKEMHMAAVTQETTETGDTEETTERGDTGEATSADVTEEMKLPVTEETTTEVVTEPLSEAETVEEVLQPEQAESYVVPETQEYIEETNVPSDDWNGVSSVYNCVEFPITDEDYYWLIRIVETEAGDQDDIGKILVANVIFNRVRNYHFPNTVQEVIFQNNGRTYQFEPVKNQRIYNTIPTQNTIDCVGRAMAGEDYSKGALYFCMWTPSSSWFNRSLTLLFVHGDHYFYTE